MDSGTDQVSLRVSARVRHQSLWSDIAALGLMLLMALALIASERSAMQDVGASKPVAGAIAGR